MCQPNTDDTDPNINLGEDNLEFTVNEQPEKTEGIDHLWIDHGGEG
jgi:hypothetical protein